MPVHFIIFEDQEENGLTIRQNRLLKLNIGIFSFIFLKYSGLYHFQSVFNLCIFRILCYSKGLDPDKLPWVAWKLPTFFKEEIDFKKMKIIFGFQTDTKIMLSLAVPILNICLIRSRCRLIQ